MNKWAAFEAGFQDEILKLVGPDAISKEAGFGDVMLTLGKAVGKAKSMAAPLLASAGEAYSGSSVGKYLSKSPRLSSALRFSGTMAAGGAGFQLAQKAVEPTKKEVHILPKDAQQGVMSQFQTTPLQRYGV